MATNNNEIPMNIHPPGVDQLEGVRKITRAMEDLADRVSDQQTAPNRTGQSRTSSVRCCGAMRWDAVG
jgi:hypothetical protein